MLSGVIASFETVPAAASLLVARRMMPFSVVEASTIVTPPKRVSSCAGVIATLVAVPAANSEAFAKRTAPVAVAVA